MTEREVNFQLPSDQKLMRAGVIVTPSCTVTHYLGNAQGTYKRRIFRYNCIQKVNMYHFWVFCDSKLCARVLLAWLRAISSLFPAFSQPKITTSSVIPVLKPLEFFCKVMRDECSSNPRLQALSEFHSTQKKTRHSQSGCISTHCRPDIGPKKESHCIHRCCCQLRYGAVHPQLSCFRNLLRCRISSELERQITPSLRNSRR
jgi:hypothetical protein